MQASLSYAYALWAAEVLLESQGAEAVRQLLRNPARLNDVTTRLNQSLKN